MATLIAYQDGDFTGATTFKGVATGASANQTSGINNTGQQFAVTTSYSFTPAFTMTNAEVIEGVILNINQSGTPGTNTTVTVGISNDNGVTVLEEVTINVSDLPGTGIFGFTFFKFANTVTGNGNSTWRLGIKSSQANTLRVFRSATTNDFVRIFRRSTTATPATTDEFYICGERTAPATVTTVTVTMDQTATTSYGAMNIGDAGTVSYGTSASTNYYLKLAGNLNVWGNGTLNIGTSGTRIPSTSTATLEFNCSSNVQFGLEASNGSTVNIYGAEKANTKVLLTADANSGQAVITVEDTTGWAVSDEVAIASTTRTPGQSEKRTISSIGSATQATMTANLGFTHQGTSPYQGEVINLTRNVKIRGTSSTLQSYVNCAATSSFTADNAEFFFLGSATANKRGIDSATTSEGTFSMNGCALRDFTVTSSRNINCTGTSGSPSVTDCVFFSIATGSSESIFLTATSGTPVITGNWILATHSSTGPFFLQDVGAVVSNNRCAGGTNCFQVNENATIGVFDNNIGHSAGFNGIDLRSTGTSGEITNCTGWRNLSGGFTISSPVLVDNINSYHNTNYNILCGNDVKVINSTFNGGTGQSLGASNRHVDFNGSDIVFENCDFGQTNQAANFVNVLLAGGDATFIDCDIAEGLDPLNRDRLQSATTTPVIGLDKLNSTSGNHRAYKRFGYAGSDQSVYRTASPSEVLVPNSASGKLPSGSKKFGVASGNDATVSVWVRKSSTYNGAEPRLILKRNIVGGVTSDQVLATLSGGTEEWLELTASTPTVTDDCVLEVYVDCSATAGTVNIDDWSIS